ncbi:hypothetical protein [Streptomyces cinereoruber]|uniref:hypothetical protein n=1 Tax=Streptomyces cinereoruber TaxID=67260 RepID=UPI003645AA1D
MSTNTHPKPPRSTWTTETIRAVDLAGKDTVLIDGIWREIFDTWKDGDDPAAMFGEDDPTTKALLEKIDWGSPCWVGVRYVSEERSDEDHVEDALHFFRLRDLVQVQKEIPADVPAPTPRQVNE